MGAIEIPEIKESKISTDLLFEIDHPTDDSILSTGWAHVHPTTQMLLTSKPSIHMPEAGLNPLVDAAAYIFSIMGKLKYTKHYKDLNKLHLELIKEIENFSVTIQTYSYQSKYLLEYMLICRYTLCATLDGIISNTAWGSHGLWDKYNLVDVNNQSALSHENILIILERLVSEPDTYIDVMEFMYICISFGLTFKLNRYRSEFSQEQLDQIKYSLYRRIRAYRGNYNKILSPNTLNIQVKTPRPKTQKSVSTWMKILLLISFCAALFSIGKYCVDLINLNQAPQRLSLMELNGHEKINELSIQN